MKKFLLCLLALVLALSASAMADVTVVKTNELKSSTDLCTYSNNYIARTEGGYALFDVNGNMLSDVYKDMRSAEYGKYLKVQNVGASTNLNCVGLLDAQGNELLPMEYGAIVTYYAEDWVFAHVLEPADGDVGEYSDSKGNKYIIGRTDVVYKGEKISLNRDYFKGSYRVTDRGPSIFIKINDKSGYWLYWMDGAFHTVEVTSDSYISNTEFTSSYKGPVIHSPTQQEAFTASCTLTPDQVQQHIWYDDSNKRILDLQGNVLADKLHYDRVSYRSNYMEMDTNSYQDSGVMTFDGKVIIPAKYEDIARNLANNRFFGSGYNAVFDADGNLYFYDEAGNITASAEYQLGSYSDYKGFTDNAPIVYVKNLGKYMIITATHGTLPETYEEAMTCSEMQKVIRVKKDGMWGVIDMAGNTVVPFAYTYTPSISEDGTVVLCQKGFSEYVLYQLSYTDAAAPAVPESWTETKVSGEEMTDAPVLADGAWACTCGAVNTGKFCAECGSKKPEPTPTPAPAPAVDDGSWTCTCGSVNAGKFCPECGSKKPEATPVPTPVPEPQCASCGYKPEGSTPKFCPECGSKF